MTYGIGPSGWVTKDLATILSEIEADQRSTMGVDLDVSPSSPVGIFNGIISAKLAELWQQGGNIYNSQYPDGASDTSLDHVLQLTGVVRLPYTKSAVTATIGGVPGTVLYPGYDNTRAKNLGTNSLWALEIAPATSLVIPAASSITARFEAADYGPVPAVAGSLSVIDTPITGWNTITNALDATLGRNVETDAAARLRRVGLLNNPGNGTVDAIRSKVLAVTDVTSASVFENVTLVTDADGVPAKSIEVVILGGDINSIAQAIWDSKDAGISAFGSSTGNAYDALSTVRVMAATRPTETNIYVSLTALTGLGWGASVSADLAKSLTAFGATLGIGGDVIESKLYAPLSLNGVIDITDLRLGTSASPTGTANLAIGSRALSKWDTSRIVVTLI